MASPVYLICARSTSEDRHTNLVSLFSIMERVTIFQYKKDTPQSLPPGVSRNPFYPFRIVAVWMKSDGDTPDVEFETEVELIKPTGERITALHEQFRFSKSHDLQRIVVDIDGPQPFGLVAGLFVVEAKLRRVGAQAWTKMRYPIRIDVVLAEGEGPTEEAAPLANLTGGQ